MSNTIESQVRSHDARAIANVMLDRASERQMPLTLMQLLKLLYFAHGWSLAFHERPLIFNAPQAWQHGPVYPRVYKELSGIGSDVIRKRIVERGTGNVLYPDHLSDGQSQLIDDVLQSYGDRHAFRLSNITHQSGTPWEYTINNIGVYKDIPEDLMRSHFLQLRAERNIPDRYN